MIDAIVDEILTVFASRGAVFVGESHPFVTARFGRVVTVKVGSVRVVVGFGSIKLSHDGMFSMQKVPGRPVDGSSKPEIRELAVVDMERAIDFQALDDARGGFCEDDYRVTISGFEDPGLDYIGVITSFLDKHGVNGLSDG